MPSLPFVKVADQEDMKLALMLNVIDPTIGGVLIMGERGTGKSVAVSKSSSVVSFWGLIITFQCQFLVMKTSSF